MNDKIATILMILKKPRYVVLAIVSSIGFGILHYFLSLSLLQSHITTVAQAMPYYLSISLFLSVVIAAFAGINVSLIAYKFKNSRMKSIRKSGSSSLLGSSFAVFTPGCPACTTPLAVLLGTVGGIALFPLQGLELKLISIGALVFACYWIAKGINQPSCCRIKEKKNESRCRE